MTRTRLIPVLFACAVLAATDVPASAQPVATPSSHAQVLSANPFGLLLGWFNAEFERKVSDSATAGFGGSHFNFGDDDPYSNADVFYRYYPGGRPLEGFAIGLKAGLTGGGGSGPFFGAGIDTNWSWLLGKKDNIYVGLGFGLKRLIGADEGENLPMIVPTIRIINLGIAF